MPEDGTGVLIVTDTQIDLFSEEKYNDLNKGIKGIRLMKPQVEQPEAGQQLIKNIQAIVNGVPFEFRNITGKSRQIEQEFSDAKIKDKAGNVFMNIDSDISRYEVRRRIVMVLDRHPDYTGEIVVSFQGKSTYFWDTGDFG
jgi:hypothetical protein